MASCKRCGRLFTGDEDYCEPCEEFVRQVEREEYGIFCTHCQKIFLPGAFEQHAWTIYRRTREKPIGRKAKL